MGRGRGGGIGTRGRLVASSRRPFSITRCPHGGPCTESTQGLAGSVPETCPGSKPTWALVEVQLEGTARPLQAVRTVFAGSCKKTSTIWASCQYSWKRKASL